MALTDKQKEAREAALGSSDAPIVAGVSPYKSPLELFYQLHGELPRYTDEETQAQRIGSRLEPVIAELAAEELSLKIRRSATRRHPKYAWMVANLDFEIVNNAKGPGVLEVKNRGTSKAFDVLPDDIHLQTVQQMAVTNRDWGIVAVLFGFGNLKTFEVQRDKELEEYLIEIEARFMLRVQKGEPPTEAWTPENLGILKKLYPTDSGKTIVLPDNALTYVGQFRQAKEELDRIEAQKAEAEGWLKAQMQDASAATVPGYSITWKTTKSTKRLDLDRLKAEHPEIVEQYMVDAPGYRRFLIKPTKEITR